MQALPNEKQTVLLDEEEQLALAFLVVLEACEAVDSFLDNFGAFLVEERPCVERAYLPKREDGLQPCLKIFRREHSFDLDCLLPYSKPMLK